MDNHVHLLIEHTTIDLDVIMKKIEVKFVRWYNKKYNRIGNLFQERFKSEPVNDHRYLQTVFRYIHQNPIHAGLEKKLGTYLWSSYYDYLDLNHSLIDIDKMLDCFPSHADCINYLQTISNKKCLEYFSSSRLPDKEALKIIQEITNCHSPSDFQRLDLANRNQYLEELAHSGISIRQLSRLTGISRTSISTVLKTSHEENYRNLE